MVESIWSAILAFNSSFFLIVSTILFFCVALFFTIQTSFLQIRALPRFFRLVSRGVDQRSDLPQENMMNSLQALFTAMGTTIGIGNIVGPSVAIMAGGPGALFWLILYIILGSVTKYVEVVYAISTRVVSSSGYLIGGPMIYLNLVHPYLATWYAAISLFLFISWSALQTNTLATICAQEGVAPWLVGALLALFILMVLYGGARRVGDFASKLVPFMFFFYLFFVLTILFKDLGLVKDALWLVMQETFYPQSIAAGLTGFGIMQAMRFGIYRGIFITESGLGTAAIPHATANVRRPTDQAILAMGATIAEFFLALLSGLLVLVTGVWQTGQLRSTLVYEIFKLHAPWYGQLILLVSIILLVLTTLIGNSFNGIQTFASLTSARWLNSYRIIIAIAIFLGALTQIGFLWDLTDFLLTLVAVPHLIGLVLLAIKRPNDLKF